MRGLVGCMFGTWQAGVLVDHVWVSGGILACICWRVSLGVYLLASLSLTSSLSYSRIIYDLEEESCMG